MVRPRQGWPAFFRILRIYLAHFRGQPSEVIPLLAMSSESKTQAKPTIRIVLDWPAMVAPH